MENSKKILNLLGLATKAGKIASGEFAAEKAVKSGKAHLVIVSEEASDNTRKMFQICVLTTRSRFTFSERKKNWGTQWEKRCGHLWPYWMQVFPRHS